MAGVSVAPAETQGVCERGRGELVVTTVCCGVQDAVKLYCLCKLPHDGERPMLQCDACRDWFHWDCVGLTPPGDDEDDEEVAPADFQCPSCCIKVISMPLLWLQRAANGSPCSQTPWRPRAGCPCCLCTREGRPQLALPASCGGNCCRMAVEQLPGQCEGGADNKLHDDEAADMCVML